MKNCKKYTFELYKLTLWLNRESAGWGLYEVLSNPAKANDFLSKMFSSEKRLDTYLDENNVSHPIEYSFEIQDSKPVLTVYSNVNEEDIDSFVHSILDVNPYSSTSTSVSVLDVRRIEQLTAA